MIKRSAIASITMMIAICLAFGTLTGCTNTDPKPKDGKQGAKVESPKKEDKKTAKKATAEDSDIIPVGESFFKGPADAAVTIVEFSDFQCPFCSRVNPTIDKIRKEYPNDVRVVFKHNPLSFHKDAPLASEACLAAGAQGKFWEYHDVLFKNQKALKRDSLEKYAQDLGLDMAKFKADLDGGKYKKQVAADQAVANKIGARGTPNFFVNGIKVVGAKPFDSFKETIDKELAAAKGSSYKARVKANYKKSDPPKRNNRPPADDKTVYKVPMDNVAYKGDAKNAVVTIAEFSDFQCPFCSRVNPTLAKILDEYKGQVRIGFKHLPLPFHKDAPLASEACLAAGEQGKFWEYHDVLFKNQKALKRDSLEKYAQDLGLNMAKFKKALDDGKFKKQVEADKALARKVGARGTPHFFINGVRLSGAQPFDRFKEKVEAAIKAAKPHTDKGLKGDALYAAIMKNAQAEFKAAPSAKPPVDNKVYTIDSSKAPTKGGKNAKVTIVEFSDFQCPFCGRVNPTIDGLMKKYGDKIKVSFMHQPLPFHKDAPLAAEASLAAHEQGKFWEYHDILFKNQRALKRENLDKYAQDLGLNMDKFKKALDDGKYKAQVANDQKIAKEVGARGTPTFFVNGRKLVGAQPQPAFEALIDKALKGGK